MEPVSPAVGEIAPVFEAYYGNLYEAEPGGPPDDLAQFAADLPLLHLSSEMCDSLKAEITDKELRATPSQVHPGKVPGPNRLSAEF
ncbi:hypothetical protein NDU88_002531 [Pleurodeles waltl]|uniref:Uncharacterized protein n=1 Tax=Pleurodeles waltl TaxID=8319 RepID=A0AAV7QC06_PLEWA|nr:hypothetical protein NDU88_002531 [Pleurodeles waltl]